MSSRYELSVPSQGWLNLGKCSPDLLGKVSLAGPGLQNLDPILKSTMAQLVRAKIFPRVGFDLRLLATQRDAVMTQDPPFTAAVKTAVND
jgi:hypothetical protein